MKRRRRTAFAVRRRLFCLPMAGKACVASPFLSGSFVKGSIAAFLCGGCWRTSRTEEAEQSPRRLQSSEKPLSGIVLHPNHSHDWADAPNTPYFFIRALTRLIQRPIMNNVQKAGRHFLLLLSRKRRLKRMGCRDMILTKGLFVVAKIHLAAGRCHAAPGCGDAFHPALRAWRLSPANFACRMAPLADTGTGHIRSGAGLIRLPASLKKLQKLKVIL